MKMGTAVRRLVLAVIVALGSSVAAAQEPQPTLAEIKARTEQVPEPEKDLSDNEFRLSDEVRKLDDELLRYRRHLDGLRSGEKSLERFQTFKASALKLIQDVTAADPTKLTAAQAEEVMSKIYKIQNRLFMEHDDEQLEVSPWSLLTSEMNDPNETASARVEKLKRAVTEREQALRTYMDSIGTPIEEAAKENAEKRTALSTLIEKLQKRRDALQNHMRSLSTKNEIGSSLWIIISVIGLFSIGTIAIVLRFPHEIQVEWVASGQVIQFVTVMILLSVIMALGLSSVLKENTLGTLLGGVGGYVLSQGVGRAVAREASRQMGAAASAGAAAAAAAAGAAGVAAGPTIASITPQTGPIAGGTTVKISGTGFVAGAVVTFGGTPATVQRIDDGTAITVTSPARAAGAVDVVVTNVGGKSATSPNAFTYV